VKAATMARTNHIPFDSSLSPADALGVARRQLEREGFSWEQRSPGEAVAYERGKATERSTSWNLRIGLRAEPGRLTAERETNAAEGFLFPNAGGVVYGLLLSKFSRVCKRLARALANPEGAVG
jgi:hypothetical protein